MAQGGEVVSRLVHTQKIAGSTPVPATLRVLSPVPIMFKRCYIPFVQMFA
jgi:hypothetical protein